MPVALEYDEKIEVSAEAKALADTLVTPELFDEIADIIRRGWAQAAKLSADLVSEQVGDVVTVQARRLQKLIERETGRAIKSIEETTRARVASYIDQALVEGLSPSELSRLIAEDKSGAFTRMRARVIARTESGTAYNKTSVEGYRASGRVKACKVYDGKDCGWTSHDDPDKANGSKRSLKDCAKQPLGHPNCTRGFAPVVELEKP